MGGSTTTHTQHAPAARSHRSPARRFLEHFFEMVLVMAAGMLVLGSALASLAAAVGPGPSELGRESPALLLLGMGLSMTAPMVWWMRRRRHSWRATGEMATAMVVPTLAAVALLAVGVDDVGDLLAVQHAAMLPSMLASMLIRRQEYPDEPRLHRTRRNVGTLLAHRWPTWLALGSVAVVFADGEPPPIDTLAWLTPVLPLAYLAFGAARDELRPPAMLALQLGALLAYVGLTAIALSVDDDVARFVVAFGWIAHAVWDLAHHRADRVVPRPWAEWCAVVDVSLGAATLVLG